MRHAMNDREFLQAFNEIPVIFAGRPRVLLSHQAVLDFSIASESFQGGEHLTKLF